MGEGFVCAACDQLYRERPEHCHECGHGELVVLTFSEYRRRRRDGEEPWTESAGGGRLRTAMLTALAAGLFAVGLAAIGMGATAMAF